MDLFQRLRTEDSIKLYRLTHGFEVSRQEAPRTSTLWLRDDDGGNPDALVAFVLRLARALPLQGIWGFQFGRWCSHREMESFGGGAYVLDLGAATVLDQVCTQDWLDRARNAPESGAV